MRDRVAVFLHIPKTAGTTLDRVIEWEYRGARVVNTGLLDRDVGAFAEVVTPEQRSTADVVKGHLYYGVHDYLDRPTAYFTMLRAPVDRVRSLYQFVRTEARHPLHEEVTRSDLSLREFVESGIDAGQVDNGQVRQIVGAPTRELEARDLDTARRRIEHEFVAVGVQEAFDESLILMRRALGWRRPPIHIPRNITHGSRLVVTDEDRRLIEKHNELDLELYELALRLVQERCRAARFFGAELWSLRALNRLVKRVARLTGR